MTRVRTTIRDLLATCFIAFAVSLALVPLLDWAGRLSCEGTAHASDRVDAVADAIRTLQPAADAARAHRLAELFVAAGDESNVDPLLLVAIAMRESSFHPAVEALTKRGSAGELGLLQVHPRNGQALAMRPEGCDRELQTARCQIVTGARWLAHALATCPGSTWQGVVHYGSGRCLTEAEARRDRTAAIAASYYVRVGGTEWR